MRFTQQMGSNCTSRAVQEQIKKLRKDNTLLPNDDEDAPSASPAEKKDNAKKDTAKPKSRAGNRATPTKGKKAKPLSDDHVAGDAEEAEEVAVEQNSSKVH